MDKRELCFITVIGGDKKGIVAKISNILADCDINIEDVEMKVMEGYFVMSMFVDVAGAEVSMDELREKMDVVEKEMGLKIQIQHEDILRAMHRI